MQEHWSLPRLIFVAAISLASSLLLVVGQDFGEQSSAKMKISYSFPSQQFTLHQPVILTFKVRNDYRRPIQVDLGQDRKGGFSFTLTTPDGVKFRLPEFSREGISQTGTFSLQPGESYSQNLLLNEWYDFEIPGRYELEGHLINPIVVGDGPMEEHDQGFRSGMEIGPRNELALAKTCGGLADKVDDSTSYEQAAQAVLILSYVKDPVAVSYLRRALLAHKLVEPIAIAGLEKIGNETAVRALFEGLRIEYGDSAILSRAALERIRNQTNDPNLRNEIEQNLKTAASGPNLQGRPTGS
jgi:hypothetical protein